MALFFSLILMLSLLPLSATATGGSYDYIVVGKNGTFTAYRAPSGTVDYAQFAKVADYTTLTDALNPLEIAVGTGTTTITFGETFSSGSGVSGYCDAGSSDSPAINGTSGAIGSSGTYTIKGALKGSGTYALAFQASATGIIDGARIESTGTDDAGCAVAVIGSNLTVKAGSVIHASSLSAINMIGSGDTYIEGGTITGGSLKDAIVNASTGTLNISGGTISSTSHYAVYNTGDGTLPGKVNISGGDISSSASNTIYNNCTGKITISGNASISTSTKYATVWLNTGVAGANILEMTGGTVTNTSTNSFTLTGGNVPTAIGNNGAGTIVISDGRIESTGFGIGNKSTGAVKISGGTISVGTNGYGVANGSTGPIYLSGTPSITGGFANLVAVSSGAIHANDGAADTTNNYIGEPLSVYNPGSIISGKTIAVVGVKTGTNDTKFISANTDPYFTLELTGTNLYFVSRVAMNTTTNTYYNDIQSALGAALDGQTVKLLSDAAPANCITYDRHNIGVTLDLNGYQITRTADVTGETGTDAAVYVKDGTLTVKDTSVSANGCIKLVDTSTASANGSGVNIGAAGTAKLLSGGILGPGQAVYAYESGAHFGMSGGVLYGCADSESCEALDATTGAYISISGGYLGTYNSSAAMIWSASALNESNWSISGGYFTSHNYNDGGVKSIASFVTSGTVTELATPITNTISGALNYYYHLTIPRAITFDATTNGGTCATGTADTVSTGKLSSLPTASKTGKCFSGWYTAASGGTEITTDYVFNADTTAYAQFTDGFVFNYYSSDGSTLLRSDIVSFSGPKPIGSYVPTKTGYSFNGWATTANSTTVAYIPYDDYSSVYNAASPKPSSLSLYAIWDDVSDLNGSENALLSSELSYSDSSPNPQIGNSFTTGTGVGNIAEPHYSAYFILTGYDVDYTETDSVYLVDETASNERFYLGYLTREPVGTTQNTLSIFSIPQYVLRSGHTFHLLLNATNSAGGFGSSIKNAYMLIDGGVSNLTGKTLSLSYDGSKLTPKASLTDSDAATYALDYKLFGFDANGVPTQINEANGSVTTTSAIKTVTDTKAMTQNLSRKSRYELNVIVYKSNEPVALLTYDFNVYLLSYDLNGASGAAPDYGYALTGQKLTAPADPVNSGKVFSGWYTDKECTQKWNFASDTASADLKLFAGWQTSAYYGSTDTSRTIAITSVTSKVFENTDKNLFSVQANMQGAFGNSVETRLTDSTEAEKAIKVLVGTADEVYPFDISLYIKNTDTKTEPTAGYSVTITMPLPQSLQDKRDKVTLVHDNNGSLDVLPYTLTQKNGVWCIQFSAKSFSPYALVVGMASGAQLPYYLDAVGAKVFLGFASDASGKMKYIEKTGKVIAFVSNPKSFGDTGSHWAKNDISFVTERELFLGTADNVFSPDSGMTRAMFATVLGRLYERSYGTIVQASSGEFTDVDYSGWYGRYVNWAAKNGIITGVGGSEFLPNREITRQEMAAMLYRFAKYINAAPEGVQTTALTYPDASGISSWANEAAAYCQKTGTITGRDGGAFVPQGTATRAEVAVILERFINNVVG